MISILRSMFHVVINVLRRVLPWQTYSFLARHTYGRAIGFFSSFFSVTPDLAGYEFLIGFLREHNLMSLNGDIVEIGAFLGGGTAKLAKLAEKYGKKVYAIDLFNMDFEKCQHISGYELLSHFVGRTHEEVFKQVTRGFRNIVPIKQDSKLVSFPRDKVFVFGFIDGNHEPEYVVSDFNLVWKHLAHRGAVGFHDYHNPRHLVAQTVQNIRVKYREEIVGIVEIPESDTVILIKK